MLNALCSAFDGRAVSVAFVGTEVRYRFHAGIERGIIAHEEAAKRLERLNNAFSLELFLKNELDMGMLLHDWPDNIPLRVRVSTASTIIFAGV